MSLDKAKQWLQNHSDTLPVIENNYRQIESQLEQEKSQEIGRYVANDLGLTLALLKKVNINRGRSTAREIVESTKAAISLLGKPAFHLLFSDTTTAEQQISNQEQLFLYHQIVNRSMHNQVQVGNWAADTGHQQEEPLKLCALLAYCGEALCCVHDYKNYREYIMAGSIEDSEQQFFGFSFSQLTRRLCEKLNLPELILLSQPDSRSQGQRETLLRIIATICRQSEHGWFHLGLTQSYARLAGLLQIPEHRVISKFHQNAILAARQSILPDAWQPAARLLLIDDKAWCPDVIKHSEPVLKKTADTKPQQEDIVSRVKRLLKQHDVSQSDILSSVLTALIDELKMSKVSLLLLSRDKLNLNNRMSLGIDPQSPFHRYQIDVSRSGLLKILLKKPQAVWVNHSSFKKYQHLIPQSLLASVMTNNFVAMSLFIGQQPIGIVYADRSDTNDAIDETLFIRFKEIISLASKALTLLASRKTSG